MLNLCVLSSSSAGNSIFVSSGRTRLLIDAGLSRREIRRRLAAIGEDIDALDGVLLTHEHTDHAIGLPSLAKQAKRPLPIYLTHRTAPYLDWGECTPTLETFQAGRCFSIGDFDISSFTIPHDAADPVGFTLTAQGIKIGIATDLGYVTANVRQNLHDAAVVVLEANHDLEMLRVGPYPWSVKQRVMSRMGHLSNEMAAEFIRDHLTTVSTLILGHISEHNNHPALVREMAYRALDGGSLFTRIHVAEPGVQSEVFTY